MENINLLLDFIEGRITPEDFRDILLCYEQLCNVIKEEHAAHKSIPNYNVISIIERLNPQKQNDADLLFSIIEDVLIWREISFEKAQPENKGGVSIPDVILSYLADDLVAENFVYNKIIKHIPANITKSEEKKYCRKRQKELFRYEKNPPNWIQSSEWPIVNEKPMVFRKQLRNIEDEERMDFYFYDSDTGEERIVSQYY